jgi:DnaJ like chaperone protein
VCWFYPRRVLRARLRSPFLAKALRFGAPENIERVKNNFFETTFLLLGYLAKVDGRISQSEIHHTEQIIAQMGLGAGQRQQAIDLFRRGAAVDFKMEPVVASFLQTCGPQRLITNTAAVFDCAPAQADQSMEPAEHAALVRIASVMGLGAQLDQLLRMTRAQEHFKTTAAGSAARYQPC